MPEDYGIQQGATLPLGPTTPFTSLPQDIQDSANKASIEWGNADEQYWKAREQKIGPLIGAILSIGGGALAPLLGPLLAGTGFGAGLSNLGASALIAGGAGTAGGLVSGKPFGQAIEGGLLSGLGSFGGGELGHLLGGLGGSAGGAAGGIGGAAGGGVGSAVGGGVGAGLGNTVSELVVNGALGPGLGGALSGLGGALGGAGGVFGNTPTSSTFQSEFEGTQPTGIGGPSFIHSGIDGLGGVAGPSPEAGGGDTTVSPVDVIANTGGGGLNPGGVIGALPGLINDSNLVSTLPGEINPSNPNDPGKANPNKAIEDILRLITGGATANGGVIHGTGPTGGTPGGVGGGGPTPGGGGGTPPGGGTPGGGIPGIPGISPQAGAAPGLITTGPTGGSGAGPGGPGGFDLKGSLAPDIYPWATAGGI